MKKPQLRISARHPQREAAVSWLRENPTASNRDAAERFGVSHTAVRNWRHKYSIRSSVRVGRNGSTWECDGDKTFADELNKAVSALIAVVESAEIGRMGAESAALMEDGQKRIEKAFGRVRTKIQNRISAARLASRRAAEDLESEDF